MSEVEVAVGYVGGQWASWWITVGDDDGVFRSDAEVGEIAEAIALKQAARAKKEVAFITILHIEEPQGDLGI